MVSWNEVKNKITYAPIQKVEIGPFINKKSNKNNHIWHNKLKFYHLGHVSATLYPHRGFAI